MIWKRFIEDCHGHLVEALQSTAREHHAQVGVARGICCRQEGHLELRGQFLVAPISLNGCQLHGRFCSL
jgi:hypothetical protein